MDRKLRVKLVLVVGLLVPLINSPVNADQADSNIQEGLNQYQEGLFPEAEKNFAEARSNRPDDRRLDYNLGSSYYKQGKYEEALQDYTQSALDGSYPQLKKNSLYNAGNALFKMGKLKEAEKTYKNVLALDPSDMDAKFNLEFVREQLKKKKEKEKTQIKMLLPNKIRKNLSNKNQKIRREMTSRSPIKMRLLHLLMNQANPQKQPLKN